ncbi:hypothetical protein Taro_042203 [Colocasia esculenta]|uniref:Uncharacterized protein n=1 Tax=Colocasia esculenta TaxID=4460 RepID=A0A843WG85_COLES|nr:hypothetical protein [Colocasia esculenta]
MVFTRLSKGLSVVLFLGYLIPQLLPWTTGYLALIPGRTIPFVWNIITAGYVEKSIFGMIVSISSLLISGKLLEPIWSTREFLKFIVFVNACTLGGVYVTALISYYITKRESFLYLPLSGFHGVISGFLVGVKQIVPNQEITTLGGFHMRAKWLPSLFVLISIILSFFTSETMPYLPFVLFGTYSGWLYARYLLRDPETNLFGSPGEEFAFSTFFPPFIRSTVDALSSCCYKLWSKKQAMRKEDDDALESTSLPSLDSAEASRWRCF